MTITLSNLNGFSKFFQHSKENYRKLSCIVTFTVLQFLSFDVVRTLVIQAEMWSRSRSLPFEEDSNSGPYLFHLDFCFVAVYLTFVKFILQLNSVCTLLCTLC